MSEKRILLVDDDPEIVKTVKSYLQQAGYAVLVAYNGQDALSIVRDQAPDCVVLDVMQPDFDGWQMTPRILGREWEFLWYLLFFAFGYLLLTDSKAYFAVLDKIRIPVTIITPILAVLFFLSAELFQLPTLMIGGG